MHLQIYIFPLSPNQDENTLTQFPSSKLYRPVTDSTGEGAPSLPIHIYISHESLIDGGCLPLHHVGNKVWTAGLPGRSAPSISRETRRQRTASGFNSWLRGAQGPRSTSLPRLEYRGKNRKHAAAMRVTCGETFDSLTT